MNLALPPYIPCFVLSAHVEHLFSRFLIRFYCFSGMNHLNETFSGHFFPFFSSVIDPIILIKLMKHNLEIFHEDVMFFFFLSKTCLHQCLHSVHLCAHSNKGAPSWRSCMHAGRLPHFLPLQYPLSDSLTLTKITTRLHFRHESCNPLQWRRSSTKHNSTHVFLFTWKPHKRPVCGLGSVIPTPPPAAAHYPPVELFSVKPLCSTSRCQVCSAKPWSSHLLHSLPETPASSISCRRTELLVVKTLPIDSSTPLWRNPSNEPETLPMTHGRLWGDCAVQVLETCHGGAAALSVTDKREHKHPSESSRLVPPDLTSKLNRKKWVQSCCTMASRPTCSMLWSLNRGAARQSAEESVEKWEFSFISLPCIRLCLWFCRRESRWPVGSNPRPFVEGTQHGRTFSLSWFLFSLHRFAEQWSLA